MVSLKCCLLYSNLQPCERVLKFVSFFFQIYFSISVDYKIEGDFVYPADEFEEDAVSDDMWEPVVSIRRG